MPGKGVGSSNNYAYLVVDDKSKDAFIIDPANPPEYGLPAPSTLALGHQLTLCRVAPILKDAIQSGKINLKAIVNTHQSAEPPQATNSI